MRREAVLLMQVEVELSQLRACGLMELYCATCRYRRRRCEDQPVVLWVKVISQHYEQGTGVQVSVRANTRLTD
jgi:hypothetical protein